MKSYFPQGHEEESPTEKSFIREEKGSNVDSSDATKSTSEGNSLPPTTNSEQIKQSLATVGSQARHYRSKRVFKVIIIGDPAVGKTCLSFRFCNGRFPGPTEATIGVDFRERSLIIDDELIRVQLWDTAGQERYRQSIVAHYYRNVNAVVFVYDVNNLASFKSLPLWINECHNHCVKPNDTPHILM